MEMISKKITFPKGMAPFLDVEDPNQAFQRNAMILYPFIQSMTISHGRAAEILGVHKFDLIDFYDSMGLPYLNQSVEDLEEETKDISELMEDRKAESGCASAS